MFGIIRCIRGWLERKFRHSLGMLTDDFLVVDQSQETTPTLQKCTMEIERYFLGLLPIFRVRQKDVLTLTEVVTQPIQESHAAFIQELENTPMTALLQADEYLTNSTKQRIGRVKKKAVEEIEKRYKEFNGQVLTALIKADRNAFRQLLLEQLSKVAAKTFATVIKRHLAELILRTREEGVQEGLIGEKSYVGLEQLAMPTGTRFFQCKGKMLLFVIEQPPMKRTIQTIAATGSPVERYKLSFPFVVFFVVLRNRKFDNLYVLFRTKPLRTMNDALLCPALSNIFDDFHVCFSGPATAEHPVDTAETTLEKFWGGRFNLFHVNSYFGQITLEEWEKRSQEDSLFGLSYQWRAANQTVASIMEYIDKRFRLDEKKEREGRGVNLSTLEKCVERLSTVVAQEIQEACFFLIPKWSIEEAILQDIVTRFKQMVEDICLLIRTELEEDIEGVLSERNLKRAFQKAVERAVEAIKENSDNSVVVARQALITIIKEGIRDPRSP